ncbi:MAG: class I SAM-dependent methyltransferase [Paracoccaceae bacterium]|nr:class I SAM-dependent methyltransferase [Paracoccaceae bacterium]
MGNGDDDDVLGGVYQLDSPEKTQAFYRDWAARYDEDMVVNRYVSPDRVAAAMAAEVADLTAPILDLGCGTGISGRALQDAGFTTIDATDFSDEMLSAARGKHVYRKLTKGDLHDPIPARPGDYANFAAIGVFSPGHAPADMIDTVMALLPPGGCFGFTLNEHALAEKVYQAHIEELADQGAAEIRFAEMGPHLEALGTKSMVYVLRRPIPA